MKLAVLTCLSVLALPYSTGLFFDGGATAITAATANSAVLGVGLAAKLAGLAGGLALAGSGGSRSRSPSRTYYRSRGRSYRGKREALFFDGGATAITAATANSAVLGVGLAAKLAGLAGGLALAGNRGSSSRGRSYRSRGHSYRGKREALFFDGGATITAATANSALLGVAIGAKLAGLAGGLALGGSRGSSSGSSGRYRSSRYSSRGHSYRGKREALFFDGGATITAATANSALLGVAIGAKLAGLAGGLALGGSRGSSSGSSGSYRSSRYSSRGHSYRGKREALFFDGGATITAATANSALLGVAIGAKLAGLAGGLALGGSRSSSSGSSGRYRSSRYSSRGHSYRGKREALFFDGGATITAATANSALLGVAIGAKLAGLAGGLALGGSRGSSSGSSGRYRSSRYSSRGHSYRGKREALFFDGGATITAATANSALLGVAIGAKLAGLAGGLALSGSRGSSSGSSGRYRSSRYSSRGHSYRGKREAEAEAMTELLEAAFVGMEEQGTTGCFQRLFCDMSAQPSKYEDLAPMAVAVRAGASMQFQATEAANVASKLNQALEYGKVMVTYAGEPNKCETVFNQCPWSGQKMVEYIGQIEEYEQFLLASNGL